MELTKQDTQKAKGIAIVGMVMLHLFCRLGELPYTPWIWIGDTPLIYYLGLFGDICVPIYCFCSGYAHYLLKERKPDGYNKFIPQKIIRFLCNYWLIVVVFSVVGLGFGNGTVIPGSWGTFFGNMLLYRLSYNGAWWFVVTYIILSLLSPIFIWITDRVHPVVLLGMSGILYFVSYLFRFRFILNVPDVVLDWVWNQGILLGTSQFGYISGMVCRKERWVSKLRGYVQCAGELPEVLYTGRLLKVLAAVLPFAAFGGHCIVQSLIVAPFTAGAVLFSLFILTIPSWLEDILLLLGKHSTNIWLCHMFFYFILFDGLVFVAKYPIFILMFMMGICIGISCVINGFIRMAESGIKRVKAKI